MTRAAVRGVILALGIAAGAAGLMVAPTSAAEATFGDPTATATWGMGVSFRQPVVLGRVPRRVEIVIESSDPSGAYVEEVPGVGAGATDLSYLLDAGSLGFLPNSPFTAHWRITDADGSIAVGPPARATYVDTRFDWRTKSGPIVRVHWYTGSEAFGSRALSIGEEAIDRAATLLGVAESEPVDFFIYADEQAFYDALGPGTRENVGGQANTDIRTLFALITPDEIDDAWVGTVIPHELTHLVFATAVDNPYHDPPRWLNEGLAVYLSQGYDSSDRGQTENAARNGELMPLDALTGQFPTTAQRFGLAYAESVSAVDYLVRTYGRDDLVRLIRSYAGGMTDDEAFTTALGIDATVFGDAWLADLGAMRPEPQGPRPAPPGPVPTAWTAPPPDGAVGGGTTGAGMSPAAPTAGAGATTAAPGAPATPRAGTAVGPEIGLAALAIVLAVAGVGLIVVGRRRSSVVPTAPSPAAAGSGPDADDSSETAP